MVAIDHFLFSFLRLENLLLVFIVQNFHYVFALCPSPKREEALKWCKICSFFTWVIYFVGCRLISIIYVPIKNSDHILINLLEWNGNEKPSRASIWFALEPSKIHLLFCFWAFLRLFSHVPLMRKSHRRNPCGLIRRAWSNITVLQDKEWKTGIMAFKRSLRLGLVQITKSEIQKKEKSPGIFLRHVAKIFHIGS